MKNKNRFHTCAILLDSLILLTSLLYLGFFLGLTKTYEDISRHTEVFELPSEPYDLIDAEKKEKAFTIEYPSDEEFTLL